jgi:hypothetical protein
VDRLLGLRPDGTLTPAPRGIEIVPAFGRLDALPPAIPDNESVEGPLHFEIL